jgi:succinate-acetate transporter protein
VHVTERLLDRPGTRTPAEEPAGNALLERVQVVLRPLGAPLAIGLFGLGAATLVLAGLQLGWVGEPEGRQVAAALVGFAFPAQLLAGVFAMLARDGAAATAMLTLSLTWLVVGSTLWISAPGSTSDALGLFLAFAATALTLCAVTTALGKLVPAAVFGVAALRFGLTAVYELSGRAAWEDAAGVVGLGLFALAMYAGWAVALEESKGRALLPLGRRAGGRLAVDGSLFEQVRRVSGEPGVRAEL